MIRHIVLMSAMVAILWASPASQAAPADHPRALLTMLRAIDTMPTAEAIRKVTTSPEETLRRMADDELLGQYVRRRATSLMSLFPGKSASRHLTDLTQSRSDRVRWVAVYTFIRMHGQDAPKRARAFAQEVLKTGGEGRREAAIRGLRHVPGKASVTLVTRHAKKERAARVLAAIRRFKQVRSR